MGAGNAVDNGVGFCPRNGVNHYPILFPDAKAKDGLFSSIVVHWNISII